MNVVDVHIIKYLGEKARMRRSSATANDELQYIPLDNDA